LADDFEVSSTFLEELQKEHRKVKAVMSPAVVATVTDKTPAHEVARLMNAKNIRRVPVVRDGKLVGIVARSDLMRALAEKLGEKPAAATVERLTLNEALRRRRDETGG
jgi:signal-transduction protein with cAMP-binding, CBS, and nucleotidyltransferase domain